MAIKIQTAEAPDIQQTERNVGVIQEQARNAEEQRKQLELLLQQAREAELKREKELQEAGGIEKEIGEKSSG
jgi:hypothetical protein